MILKGFFAGMNPLVNPEVKGYCECLFTQSASMSLLGLGNVESISWDEAGFLIVWIVSCPTYMGASSQPSEQELCQSEPSKILVKHICAFRKRASSSRLYWCYPGRERWTVCGGTQRHPESDQTLFRNFLNKNSHPHPLVDLGNWWQPRLHISPPP